MELNRIANTKAMQQAQRIQKEKDAEKALFERKKEKEEFMNEKLKM